MTFNDISRVFHADGFDDLLAAFTASHQAGEAHIFTRTYEVRGCARVSVWWRGVVDGITCQGLGVATDTASTPAPPLTAAAASHTPTQVLHNSFMGVAGGYQASVMWVLHGRSSEWEEGLAEQTQRWLAKQRETPGPYQNYPFTQHTSEAPGPLISLLSQQASWSFRTKKAALAEFVAAAGGSTSGPGEEVIRGNEWR